jgi:hypothetical protein
LDQIAHGQRELGVHTWHEKSSQKFLWAHFFGEKMKKEKEKGWDKFYTEKGNCGSMFSFGNSWMNLKFPKGTWVFFFFFLHSAIEEEHGGPIPLRNVVSLVGQADYLGR